MERLNLRQILQQRKKQYWVSIAPYFRYVGGSLLGFILLIGFGFYGYGYFVDHLPDHFPVYVFIAALLAFPNSSGSFRTYLRKADIVFLLPMESSMPAYLKPCLRSAYIWHVLIMTVIWLILWPLFQAVHEYALTVLFIVWIQLILMKAIVMVGVWQENQIQESRTRQAFTWTRLVSMGLLIYVALTQSLAWSLFIIGLTSIGYLLILRNTARYNLHWERLFVLEQRSRSRWITWFNLFVEVPREHSPVRQTHILHRIARILSFRKSNAYHYLYLLTWIRSELFLVVVRLTIVAVILIVVISSLWIKIVLFVMFAYVLKLQLSELEQYHKNVEVSSVYPINQHQRAQSVRFIALRVYVVILVVLLLLTTSLNHVN
jgi:ABC-2 type transport system permease protein